MNYASKTPQYNEAVDMPPTKEPELGRILNWMQKNNSIAREMILRLDNISNALMYTPNKISDKVSEEQIKKEPICMIDHYNNELSTQSELLGRFESIVNKLNSIIGT